MPRIHCSWPRDRGKKKYSALGGGPRNSILSLPLSNIAICALLLHPASGHSPQPIFTDLMFLEHKVTRVHVYKSVTEYMLNVPDYLYPAPPYFHHPQIQLGTHKAITPTPYPWQPLLCSLSLWVDLFWVFPIGGNIEAVTFAVLLLSPSPVFSRIIHGVACIGTSFCFNK